jgi:hypothetical protein
VAHRALKFRDLACAPARIVVGNDCSEPGLSPGAAHQFTSSRGKLAPGAPRVEHRLDGGSCGGGAPAALVCSSQESPVDCRDADLGWPRADVYRRRRLRPRLAKACGSFQGIPHGTRPPREYRAGWCSEKREGEMFAATSSALVRAVRHRRVDDEHGDRHGPSASARPGRLQTDPA